MHRLGATTLQYKPLKHSRNTRVAGCDY